MCVFLYTRVFYHCPTTSVAPRLKNTCRPGRKFFHFQNHYRPCVGHATARATLDCVHRVTVLCTLSHISDHLGVSGVRSTHAVPHCSCCVTVSYSAVLIPCCAVPYVYYAVSVCSPMPEGRVGNGGEWQVPSQIGGPLPIPTTAGDQTKNHVVLHVESPTKPYQDPCPLSVCHWCVWLGAGSAYQVLPTDRSGCVPFSCSSTTHYQPRC